MSECKLQAAPFSRYYKLFSAGVPVQTHVPTKELLYFCQNEDFMDTLTPSASVNTYPLQYSSFATSMTSYKSTDSTPYEIPLDDLQCKEKLQNKTKTRTKPGKPFCEFCKNNNEDKSVYLSHVLKDMEGRVVCPVRSHFNIYLLYHQNIKQGA